jgi:hypothetical protein
LQEKLAEHGIGRPGGMATLSALGSQAVDITSEDLDELIGGEVATAPGAGMSITDLDADAPVGDELDEAETEAEAGAETDADDEEDDF